LDNDISHLEMWIPILDQTLKSPLKASSPLYEVSTALSYQENTLNYDIKRIGILKLDAKSSQSIEKPWPTHKFSSKWVIKTLNNVHFDEVKEIGTRDSTSQDGDDAYNSNLGFVYDMDVSYHYKLKLFLNFEPISF